MGLWYSKDTGMSLTAYADADHAGCQDTRRSTSGSAQFLGDKLVSWSSKKQKCTAISSTEDEFNKIMAFNSLRFILGLHSMTPATSSSRLIPNPISQQPCIPPKKDDWDRFFQPMFDEYFNPQSIAVSPVQETAAPRAIVLADSLVATSID
ncbi:hypothetical protein Tco_1533343 [Tanacetum coccineum]